MIRIIILFVFSLVFFHHPTYAGEKLMYWGLGEERSEYTTELLETILAHSSNAPYTASVFPGEIPHHRAFQLLEKNEIDVVIGYATDERIDRYLAIPLPIMKGLNGWRAAVIHSDNIQTFSNIRTLVDLRPYTVGSFHTWTDNKILQDNNLSLMTGTSFDGLFHMLHKKRFDFLSLTILEAEREAKSYRKDSQLDVVVDPNILLVYPVCFFFYVEKSNTKLADLIETGFENIIKNNKFEQLFNKYHANNVNRLLSGDRTIIRLKNNDLPSLVPIDRKSLWFGSDK